MLIFENMKYAYSLTFFFRINNSCTNKQKGRDIPFFSSSFLKHIQYTQKAITKTVGSDSSNFFSVEKEIAQIQEKLLADKAVSHMSPQRKLRDFFFKVIVQWKLRTMLT